MTVQQCYQYSFISLICLGILIQNYLNIRRYGNRTLSGLFFRLLVLSLMGCSILEIIYGLRESGLFGNNLVFAYTEEILYAIISMLAAYFWYIASELRQNSRTVATRKMRFIVSIPLIFMVVMTLLTPLNHLVFYFEDGHYTRGPLLTVFSVVMAIFIVWTGVSALVKSFQKKYYMEKSYFRIIALYAFILLFFQGAQTLLGPIFPFRTMGALIVIYIIQQKYIKGNIYIDNLTGANNRNAADRYLNNHLENKNNNLKVAMIDVDHFKPINDTYGHQAGDKALQILAKAFMTNLTNGSFFARYGGDEFVLIDTSNNDEEIEKIVQNARISLKEICAKENITFNMDFSCGITKKTSEIETIPDLLEKADAEMYKCKKEKNALRKD